jgi:hypothetical protein
MESGGSGSFATAHVGPDAAGKGPAHAGVTEEGREPGSFPNVTDLSKWVQHRGLGAGQTPARAVYLVGRAIAQGGTPSRNNPRWKVTPTYLEPTFKELQRAIDAGPLADAVVATMHKELPG